MLVMFMHKIINNNINMDKVNKYGFVNNYLKIDLDNDFYIEINIKDNNIYSKLIDNDSNMEYSLVDTNISGKFVSDIRNKYLDKVNDIVNNITNNTNQLEDVIKYIYDKYHDNVEYLWEDKSNFIIRNKYNKKWYALFSKITKDKLGLDSKDNIIVITLTSDKTDKIIDNKYYFKSYHMNKKNWFSIILDNGLDINDIYKLIDKSYEISLGEYKYLDKILEYLLMIPKGRVSTYSLVASYLGDINLKRVVGNLLHKNPDGDKYPCYKIVNSKGELSANFAFGGENEQANRLRKDGIEVNNNKVDLNKYLWDINCDLQNK